MTTMIQRLSAGLGIRFAGLQNQSAHWSATPEPLRFSSGVLDQFTPLTPRFGDAKPPQDQSNVRPAAQAAAKRRANPTDTPPVLETPKPRVEMPAVSAEVFLDMVLADKNRLESSFKWAFTQNFPEVIKMFFQKGYPVDGIEFSTGDSHFIKAASAKKMEIAQVCLDMGADINLKNKMGKTALFHAVVNGDLSMVEFLLKNGADPNIADNTGITPLMTAAISDAPDGRKIFKLLLDKADPHAKSEIGNTAVLLAIGEGNVENAKDLIDKGVDLNVESDSGATPLLLAIEKTDSAFVNYLIDHGADPNQPNKHKFYPVMKAAKEGKQDTCATLMAQGAIPDVRGMAGETAMHYAALANDSVVIEMLAQAGVPINQPDNAPIKSTPLMLAIGKYHVDAVSKLLELGASLDPPQGYNGFGKRPLQLMRSLFQDEPDITKRRLIGNITRLVLPRYADLSESEMRELLGRGVQHSL